MPKKSSGLIAGSTIALVIGSIFAIAGYCMLTFWGEANAGKCQSERQLADRDGRGDGIKSRVSYQRWVDDLFR